MPDLKAHTREPQELLVLLRRMMVSAERPVVEADEADELGGVLWEFLRSAGLEEDVLRGPKAPLMTWVYAQEPDEVIEVAWSDETWSARRILRAESSTVHTSSEADDDVVKQVAAEADDVVKQVAAAEVDTLQAAAERATRHVRLVERRARQAMRDSIAAQREGRTEVKAPQPSSDPLERARASIDRLSRIKV